MVSAQKTCLSSQNPFAAQGLIVTLDPNFAIVDYGVDFTEAIQDISNAYYSIIPHAFGRNRPCVLSPPGLVLYCSKIHKNFAF